MASIIQSFKFTISRKSSSRNSVNRKGTWPSANMMNLKNLKTKIYKLANRFLIRLHAWPLNGGLGTVTSYAANEIGCRFGQVA
eukprot:3418943-Pleurochrysis_carterae.AAC.2